MFRTSVPPNEMHPELTSQKPAISLATVDLPDPLGPTIAVICPGFSVDCLETLEEIEVENKEKFLTHGGVSYHYIPALNAEKAHIEMMGELILDKLQ